MKSARASIVLLALAIGHVGVLVTTAQAEGLPQNTGNLRYSITVSKFNNEAGYHGQWDLGNGFGEIMTHALNESGWFIVLGETDMRQMAMAEQDLAAGGRSAYNLSYSSELCSADTTRVTLTGCTGRRCHFPCGRSGRPPCRPSGY